jgi:hypothetical protein
MRVYKSRVLQLPAWRIIKEMPPTEDDFRSHLDLGFERPSAGYLRLMSCSMFQTFKDARRMADQYPDLGDYFAVVDIRKDRRIMFAPGNRGHLDVWGTPAALYACVDDWGEGE